MDTSIRCLWEFSGIFPQGVPFLPGSRPPRRSRENTSRLVAEDGFFIRVNLRDSWADFFAEDEPEAEWTLLKLASNPT
ncbi:hypothetical protein [Sulfidibacter corallicola]|uniref:Uncharacterized protein n=1 Tax=Sulfidibacter corallicola TaxID=2818388 RepID=A0A8A4TI03_SULCO|nr:hypothetical protein [Sulfidibacter corallicola]QTD48461.1 hypothetical protein J3U87_23020 [Sulfidibacter corallicola]